ncbi:hypothetical protein SNEBB_000341 [Seison nebaliae]|nr:hypothetical protein SNEBB_000341 [Seison nebaliae]
MLNTIVLKELTNENKKLYDVSNQKIFVLNSIATNVTYKFLLDVVETNEKMNGISHEKYLTFENCQLLTDVRLVKELKRLQVNYIELKCNDSIRTFIKVIGNLEDSNIKIFVNGNNYERVRIVSFYSQLPPIIFFKYNSETKENFLKNFKKIKENQNYLEKIWLIECDYDAIEHVSYANELGKFLTKLRFELGIVHLTLQFEVSSKVFIYRDMFIRMKLHHLISLLYEKYKWSSGNIIKMLWGIWQTELICP